MVARASKNNGSHDVTFYVLVVVAVAAADKGVIRPCRCPLTLMWLHRRRVRDPSLLKLQSANINEYNDALITGASKNNKDHLGSSSGLWTTMELPAQPDAIVCQEATPWIRGQEVEMEAEAEAEAEVTRGHATTSHCKRSGGARIVG